MKRKLFLITMAMTTSAAVSFAADAAANRAQHCAYCHGKDVGGSTMMGKKLGAKDYRDAKAQAAFSDAEAAKAIKDGRGKMKGFAGKLSEADIKALVGYVRSLKK
jgi:mono/diheme cytochrome c family protein